MSTLKTPAFILFALNFLIRSSFPSPITFPDDDEGISPQETLDFLHNFGYLANSVGDDLQNLHNQEAIENAIGQLQTFAGIPATGKLDATTVKLLKSPRCGNSDFSTALPGQNRRKRFVIGSHGWKKRNLKYHLANWSSKLNKTAIEDSLETAFKAWSAYSRLSFEATSNATAADISVLFGKYQHGDGHPFDGPGRVLAHAFYPYDSGRLGGDLHFDEDESWTLGVEAKSHETDFFTVALHEIGHALGLAHSPDQTSVMFPYYQANKNEFALGYDDILAMYELYIQNFDGPETEQTTSTATTTTTTTTTTSSSKTFSTTIMPTDDRWQNDEGYENRNASNICSGLQLDTIVNLRGELFAFRDKLMWRFIERGHLREQYPAEFTQMFPALNADKIDAVYETNEGNIVFFSGSKYWVYDGYQFSDDSPRMISQLGLTDVGKIDAVFVWPKNGRTYVFSGQKYWKLNEAQTYTEDGYPLLIRDRWQNVPDLLDAIFAWKDGKTYIFKGKHFYELDDRKIYAEISSESTVHHWFGC